MDSLACCRPIRAIEWVFRPQGWQTIPIADLSLQSVELEIIEILRESGLDFSSLDLVEETLRATGKAGDDIFSPESSEILYHLFELRSALRTNPDFFELGRSGQVS